MGRGKVKGLKASCRQVWLVRGGSTIQGMYTLSPSYSVSLVPRWISPSYPLLGLPNPLGWVITSLLHYCPHQFFHILLPSPSLSGSRDQAPCWGITELRDHDRATSFHAGPNSLVDKMDEVGKVTSNTPFKLII